MLSSNFLKIAQLFLVRIGRGVRFVYLNVRVGFTRDSAASFIVLRSKDSPAFPCVGRCISERESVKMTCKARDLAGLVLE